MNIRIFGTVNRAQREETFLTAVCVDKPGAQALLVDLFKDRNPLCVVASTGHVILRRVDSALELHDLISFLDGRKAVIGRQDGEIFIVVKFPHKRLIDSLVRSARAMRQNKYPVRLIENERDLLNSHFSVPTRVYKDDE